MDYSWDFISLLRPDRIEVLAEGAIGTVKLTASALALAIPLGLFLALCRLVPIRPVQWAARLITELSRASVPLVLLFWFYFAAPLLLDVNLDTFAAATLALGLNACGYFAELFRNGIVSVPRGQWEAAKALGLHTGQTLRLIVLPLAIRQMLPVMLSLSIEVVKATSLAAAIAYMDLTYAAAHLSSTTFRTIEVYTIIAVLYFVFLSGASRITALVERKMALKGNF